VTRIDDGGSFLARMWRAVSPLVECSLIFLLVMFLWMLVDLVERGVRYGAAMWQSRSFLKAIAGWLAKGEWDGVMAIAETKKKSHVAAVFLGGLREFRTARECVSAERTVEAAKRGTRIAANLVHEQMRQGLTVLDAIVTTAPLVGLWGTTIGILDSFRGYAGNKASYLAFIMTNLAEALVPTATGLVVGVFAVWCFNWRSERLAVFDAGMKITSLELVGYLEQARRTRKI
jgi:biopolymer transport protein ExbB/TolQ